MQTLQEILYANSLEHKLEMQIKAAFIESLLEDMNKAKRVVSDLVRLLGKDKCKVEDNGYLLTIYVFEPNCPKSVLEYINKVLKSNGNILHSIQGRFIENGFTIGGIKCFGTFDIFGFSNNVSRYVEPNYNIYHVTSAKNVDSILKYGLKANGATWASDTNKDLLDTNQTTNFSCKRKQNCRIICRLLKPFCHDLRRDQKLFVFHLNLSTLSANFMT